LESSLFSAAPVISYVVPIRGTVYTTFSPRSIEHLTELGGLWTKTFSICIAGLLMAGGRSSCVLMSGFLERVYMEDQSLQTPTRFICSHS